VYGEISAAVQALILSVCEVDRVVEVNEKFSSNIVQVSVSNVEKNGGDDRVCRGTQL